jgi:uncharacterized membrane protein
MLKILVAYLGTGLAFAALDAVWLTQAGPKLYRPTLDPLLADTPDLSVAVVFYLAYVAGVVALALWPNRQAGAGRVALAGALLGALCYATYDLTNQATMKVWSARITLVDICWGAFATAVAAMVGYLAWRRAARRA